MVKGRSGVMIGIMAAISVVCYVFVAYFIERHQSILLIAAYAILFGSFLLLWQYSGTDNRVRWLILLGIVFRLVLLGAFPNLSDDIYRFVWDGRLINNGVHPFAHLPSYFMSPGSPEVPGITSRLYYLLNSPNYFTIYPPVAQFFFGLSTALFPDAVHGSAIVIRSFIIIAEFASIWLMTRILFHYQLPVKNVLIYALNPLVILELTGNLHFEAFMILFLLAGIYFFIKKKVLLTALSFAFAIASKLLPLIFLPLFIRRWPLKQLTLFYALAALFTVLLFLPLMHPDLLKGMSSSLSLYFQRFEFNASIYYVLREIGFHIKGYNTIQTLGKYLALTTFIIIMAYALLHKPKKIRVPEVMLWTITIYFLLSTTLHPWYITTAVALSVFTRLRFTVLWSFMIFLTYIGYSRTGFNEMMWVTLLEYTSVFVFASYEIFKYYISQTARSSVINS